MQPTCHGGAHRGSTLKFHPAAVAGRLPDEQQMEAAPGPGEGNLQGMGETSPRPSPT